MSILEMGKVVPTGPGSKFVFDWDRNRNFFDWGRTRNFFLNGTGPGLEPVGSIFFGPGTGPGPGC